MCANNKLLVFVILLLSFNISFSQKTIIIDKINLGRKEITDIDQDTIGGVETTLATSKAVRASEIWQYISRDSLNILVKGGYPTVVAGNIVPAGDFSIIDTTIVKANPGPVTIPDGSVLVWDELILYDSLDQVSYQGDIYKLIGASTSLGQIPSSFPAIWGKQTLTGNIYEIPFYNASKSLATISTFRLNQDTLEVEKATIASVTNPYGGSNEVGVVISKIDSQIVDGTHKSYLTAKGVDKLNLEPIRATADNYIPALSSDSLYYIGEGEVFRVVGNQSSYEIVRVLPEGEEVDSFRIVPITSLAIVNENLVGASEDLASAAITDWNKEGSGRPELVQEDYYIDPFGNQTADLLRMRVGSNSRTLRHAFKDTIPAGDYYFSFWFKNVSMATSGVSISISLDSNRIARSNTESVSLITSDTTWHYYEVPILSTPDDLPPGGLTYGSIGLRFLGTVDLDTFSITRMSLTRDEGRVYVPTTGFGWDALGNEEGYIVPRYIAYARKYEPGQIIYWSERPPNDTLDTDAKYWNYLADLVEQKKLKTIFVDEEIIAEDTLYYTEGMHIVSNWHEGNFLVDELVNEKAKITCRPANGGDCIVARPPSGATTFVAGTWKNVLIVVETPTNFVMNMGGSHFGDYEDVTIMGEYMAEAGLRMGREAYTDSLASISNYIKGVRVFACGKGFFGDDLGNLTHIVSSQFHRCKIGVYADGPIYLDDVQIEKSDSMTIWADGHDNRLYFNKTYVESTNYDDGPGFGWEHSAADSVAFHIQNASIFEFEGATVAVNQTNKVIFEIGIGVDNIDIRNNRFLFATNKDFIRLAESTSIVNAMNNHGSGYKDRIEGTDGVMIKDVEIYGTNSTITDAELDNNDILYSIVEDNSELRGAGNISQWYVSGERQNFIQNSNYTENLGALFVISDTVRSPFNEVKTELIEQVGSVSGTGIFATFTNTTDLLEVDSTYTFSFYAMIDTLVASSESITLFSRYNVDTSTDSDDFILTNRYRRYHNTFVASGTANTMVIRIRNDSQIGNRIKIGQFSLVKGSRPKAYVETTPTVTVDEIMSQIKLQNDLDILGNKTLNFEGTFPSVDSLKWVLESPNDGDTIQLSYNTFILADAGDTIYLDDANITNNALVKVMSSSGVVTLSKVGAASPFFVERGSSTSNPTIVGTGAVKTYNYNYSNGNYLLSGELTEGGTLLTFGTITTPSTYTVKNGDFISIDANAVQVADWTATLDISGLPSGSRFEIYIGDADVYSVDLTTSTLANISYGIMPVTDTIQGLFNRPIHHLICTVLSGSLLVYEVDATFWGGMVILDTDPDTLTFSSGSTTPQKSTDLIEGDLNGFTYSTGRLTYHGPPIQVKVTVYISFSFSEGSTLIEGWVYKNGSEISKSEFHRDIGTSGEVGSTAYGCIISLTDGNYLETFLAPGTHTGDDDLIIENMNFTVTKI